MNRYLIVDRRLEREDANSVLLGPRNPFRSWNVALLRVASICSVSDRLRALTGAGQTTEIAGILWTQSDVMRAPRVPEFVVSPEWHFRFRPGMMTAMDRMGTGWRIQYIEVSRCEGKVVVPRKLRELIADLEAAGFNYRGGKDSHRDFVHLNVARPVKISGKAGDDAKKYQERAVSKAIEESKS